MYLQSCMPGLNSSNPSCHETGWEGTGERHARDNQAGSFALLHARAFPTWGGWKSYTSAEISISHLLVYRPAKLQVPSLLPLCDVCTLRFPLTSRSYSSYPLSSLFPPFVILFPTGYPKKNALVLPKYKDSRERENSSVRFINAQDLAVVEAHLQWGVKLHKIT